MFPVHFIDLELPEDTLKAIAQAFGNSTKYMDASVAEDHVLEAKAIMVETYGKDLA